MNVTSERRRRLHQTLLATFAAVALPASGWANDAALVDTTPATPRSEYSRSPGTFGPSRHGQSEEGRAVALPSGTIAVESRLFPQSPLYPGQEPQDVALWGELRHNFDLGGSGRFQLTPFFRYNAVDRERNLLDLREALWSTEYKEVRLRAGIGRVFWGTLESAHLVDIINQVDEAYVSDVGTLSLQRLGQPMVAISTDYGWGELSFFYLPYSRDFIFPGPHGRLRPRVPVDNDHPRFESSLERWYPGFALRYAQSTGGLDFAAYFFHGTSREPTLLFAPGPSIAESRYVPYYPVINQLAAEGSYTVGNWQLKYEGLIREGHYNRHSQRETYAAQGGGAEYTLRGLLGGNADLGLLGEFIWDSRGSRATTSFEHDLFLGTRLALNDQQDTSILFGYVQDVTRPERMLYFGASRRLGDEFRLELKGRFFLNTLPGSLLDEVRRDSYIQMSVMRYF